jgi:hypothetical protein
MVAQQKLYFRWEMIQEKSIPRREANETIERFSKFRLLSQQPTVDTPAEQPYSVVNLHGIVGIGKSHILHYAFAHFRTSHTVIWCTFDELDKALHPDHVVTWTEAARIMRQHPDYAYLPEQSCIKHKDGTLQEVPLSLLCQMDIQQTATAPHLLLLDGVDDLDASAWKWLQEYLIKPLLERPNTLIVCVSQSPILWHFWEIRDRGTLLQAKPFTLEETYAFLRLYDRELLAPPLYALTLGYPIALKTALSLLEKETEPLTISHTTCIDQAQRNLSPKSYHLLVTLGGGSIRRVEKRLLRQIMQDYVPDTSDNQCDQIITSALFELKAHHYLESYHKGHPLRFTPSFRSAITAWLQSNAQQTYLALCTFLAETYYQRFVQQPITYLHALNEWLYFTASIALIHPEDSSLELWSQRLTTVLEHARDTGERLRPHWFDEVVVMLYKDGELLYRLKQCQLFAHVHSTMHALVGDHAVDLPIFNDSETITYCINVLDLLIARLPADRRTYMDTLRPGGLMKNIAEIQPHLNTVSLRESINTIRQVLEQDPLRPGYVSRAVAFLNSRGFFPESDKHQPSRYQLHELISKLALLPQEMAQ